jgi:hypothetical protein
LEYEEAHKKKDRVWQGWTVFCSTAGLEHNPFLLELQSVEHKLIIQSFLSLYQVAHWSTAALHNERYNIGADVFYF